MINCWVWNKVIKCRRTNTFNGGNNTTIPLIGNNVLSSSTINTNNIAYSEFSPDYEILYENQTRNISLTTSPSMNTFQYIINQPSINNNVSPSSTFCSNNNDQPPEYSESDPTRNISPSTLDYRPSTNTQYSYFLANNAQPSTSSAVNTQPSTSSTINTQPSTSSTINTQPYSADNKISENYNIIDAYPCDNINSVNTYNNDINNNKDDIEISKDIKNKFSTKSGHSSISIITFKKNIKINKGDIRALSAHKLLDQNTSNLNTSVSNSSIIGEQTPSDTI